MVFAYIAEAHAVDEWQVQSNEEQSILVHQHTSFEARAGAAREGARRLGLDRKSVV